MNTQHIPPINSLLSKMPSGREIHTVKPYEPPALSSDALDAMRSAPDRDDYVDDMSSDEDLGGGPSAPVGAFPGTEGNYGRESKSSLGGSTYY
jgi:hypothetical protein